MSILIFSFLWLYLFLSSYGLEPFETKPEKIADKWTVKGIANPASLIRLQIAVINPKDAAFEDHATKIATPFSGYYRKHLSSSQLAEWVDPSPADVRKVQQWLSGYGIRSEQNHDLIEASMPISKAQVLLNTTYYKYQNIRGHIVQRTPEYYVPKDVAQLIEFVHPTVNFPWGRRYLKEQPIDPSSLQPRSIDTVNLDVRDDDPCSTEATTPACLNKLYNATYTAPYSSNITVVNMGTFGDQPNRTSLELYLKKFNPLPLKRKNYLSSVAVDGKNAPVQHDDFFDEFTQLMMGHGGTLRGSFVGINGVDGAYMWGPENQNNFPDNPKKVKEGEDGFIDYLHSLAHAEGVPSVISEGEYTAESELSVKFMHYLCKVFGQVSARGVTFLQQVDDYGSGGYANKNGTIVFEAAWPSTCPWVSGVGVTVYDRADKTEKAATWQTRKIQSPHGLPAISSGLFSQTFARPKWQDALVPPYVKKYKLEEMYANNPNTTGFVGTGRALPDFSVIGARIPVIMRGKLITPSCAACGALIAAGFIGRLNAYEESKGRPRLGHVNPFFYQNPDLFNDITCCGNNGIVIAYKSTRHYAKINPYGFPVAKGWDAVTGLGTFRFSDIQQALDRMAEAGGLD